jgi:hypothetical protein
MTATKPSSTSIPLKGGAIGLLLRFASGLRFPVLFGLTAVVFLADLVVPDFIPFVDEILLGLATLILASWRDRKSTIEIPPASDKE